MASIWQKFLKAGATPSTEIEPPPPAKYDSSDVRIIQGVRNALISQLENVTKNKQSAAKHPFANLPNPVINQAVGNAMYGLANPATGQLMAGDANSYNFFTSIPYQTYQQLDLMYRSSWMAKRVIETPVTDMVRKWRKFKLPDEQGDTAIINAREKAEKFYNVKDWVRRALTWADLYGGSALIMSLKSDTDEKTLSKPLDIKSIKKGDLQFFQVVFKDQINPTAQIDIDPYSPHFMKPLYYTISSSAEGVYVHNSRLILFDGVELPLYSALNQLTWGDSRLTSMRTIIEACESLVLNISNLVTKANVDVIQLKEYMQILASAPDDLMNRLNFDKQLLGNYNKLILDAEDKFERNELSGLTGLADVLINFLQMVSGAAGMPLSKFLGVSINGFSTGENEIIEWYDTINERQNRINPQMVRLDQIMEMTTFGELKNIEYEWVSLHELTDLQNAQKQVQNAQRDEIYLRNGVVSEKVVGKQLMVDGVYDGLTDEDIEDLNDDVDIDEETEPDNLGDDNNRDSTDT